MTNAQLAALKAYIASVPEWAALPVTMGASLMIADALNVIASPAFIVWRTNVSQDEIMRNGMDWTRVDNLSVGKARIWEWMFNNMDRTINPAKPNIRAGIDATWVGTAADLTVRAAVYGHCKRSATVGEKAFATGAGTTESPAVMDWEGAISSSMVQEARERTF